MPLPWNKKRNDPALDQALMDAAIAGDTVKMRALIKEGANVDAQADPRPAHQRKFSTAASPAGLHREFIMFSAALHNQKDAVRLLLDNKAKPDPLTVDNRSPLMAAASWNFIEVAEMLIDAGANMFQQAPSGSPFDRARNATDGVDMLHMMLTKLDDRKRDDLFFKYAASSDLRVMKAFCKLEDFDLQQQDGLGNTALILAAGAVKNHPNTAKVIQLLLDNGADVLAVNHLQETALSAAMTAGAIAKEPVRLLLEAGSEIMHENLAGITNYEAAQLAGNESLLPLFDAALKQHNLREVSKIHDGTGKQVKVKRITLKPRQPPPKAP